METGGRQCVRKTRGAEGLAHRNRQGHHGTAEHQGGLHPAPLRTVLLQQRGGHAAAQLGHRRRRAGQHAQRLRAGRHLEPAPHSLPAQTLGAAAQQGMGRRGGAAEHAANSDPPAFLQGRAGGQPQLGVAAGACQRDAAAAVLAVGAGIAEQAPTEFGGA